jgi:splicing factor 3A subunit 3
VLPGWETVLNQLKNEKENKNDKLYCIVCNRRYTNESVYEHHKKGKNHIKNAQKKANNMDLTNINNDNNGNNEETINYNNNNIEEDEEELKQEEKYKEIAYIEYQINRYKELLSDIIENTKNLIRKKQTRRYEELEAEQEDDGKIQAEAESEEEDEKPIYNPKNIPLGWDGKPIPYWLYKLHGLGKEFKCEICGNASYWGRKAFERHFHEWRHSYGMKCLQIPNTVHFKEITSIEDALRLRQALLEKKKEENFKQEEEEFEDSEGNVMNRKTYYDLKRQGLL